MPHTPRRFFCLGYICPFTLFIDISCDLTWIIHVIIWHHNLMDKFAPQSHFVYALPFTEPRHTIWIPKISDVKKDRTKMVSFKRMTDRPFCIFPSWTYMYPKIYPTLMGYNRWPQKDISRSRHASSLPILLFGGNDSTAARGWWKMINDKWQPVQS